jgi:hypothetical protein
MSVISKWSRLVVVAAAILYARPGFGAPALTTIQDVLYKADGTRFNGTLYIAWTNFESGDTSTIPTQALTIPVINGAFRVQLVPTTNASAGANYNVRYMSQGKFQFSETWAVPPSTATLRVRDVRVAGGTVVGAPPVLTQIVISDIAGLPNELTLRPVKGPGFQPARAAVINPAGQVESAQGQLSDCLRVDGSSAPCGTGGSGGGMFPAFADGETPTGIVDGINASFGLQAAPSPAGSLTIFRNGLLMRQNLDYTLSGSTVTFSTESAPQPGDVLIASYRVGDPTNPLASLASSQVICSREGVSSTGTILTSLGTCTIPASLLHPGDRIEISFEYAHGGNAASFTGQVTWGASTLAVIGGPASESYAGGRVTVGVHSTGTQWRSEWWASASPAPAIGVGSAPDSLSSGITIRFLGKTSAANSDSAILRNFTVVRYPAQANP